MRYSSDSGTTYTIVLPIAPPNRTTKLHREHSHYFACVTIIYALHIGIHAFLSPKSQIHLNVVVFQYARWRQEEKIEDTRTTQVSGGLDILKVLNN